MTDGPLPVRSAVLLLGIIGIVLVVLVAISGPVMGYATGVNQLPITEMADGDGLEDPESPAWEDVDSKTVVLSSADSGLPGASDTAVGFADVETAYTEERIYLRVTWEDSAPADAVTDPQEFTDAVAVQFPLEQDTEPPIAMGSDDQPVNVWYWNAEEGVEELYAGGMGSTTEMDEAAVSATAAHADGEWTVVFTRELDAEERQRTDLDTDRRLHVAFAVFDGSNQERAGIKAASEWHHYPLEPAAGPSALELVLWTLAGLAIVAVLVLTMYGIRNEDQ